MAGVKKNAQVRIMQSPRLAYPRGIGICMNAVAIYVSAINSAVIVNFSIELCCFMIILLSAFAFVMCFTLLCSKRVDMSRRKYEF